jgi:hypothetical protein
MVERVTTFSDNGKDGIPVTGCIEIMFAIGNTSAKSLRHLV